MRPLLAALLFSSFLLSHAHAQVDATRVQRLEDRVTHLEREVKDAAGVGLVLFLFGTFCALWAQNTRRSAWLWFFFGLLTGPIAVLFLLAKNSHDESVRRAERLAELESRL